MSGFGDLRPCFCGLYCIDTTAEDKKFKVLINLSLNQMCDAKLYRLANNYATK